MQSSMLITTSRLGDDMGAYNYNAIDYGFETDVRQTENKLKF